MYTIKQASVKTGIPVELLRAWERRYAVVTPQRSESGYRLYDDDAIVALIRMRTLVGQGWTPANAARSITGGGEPAPVSAHPEAGTGTSAHSDDPVALTARFLAAAESLDVAAVETVLDHGFAQGTFETVVDSWLMPTLRALGDAWAEGRVDVSGEHVASHAVMRRLSAAFSAAGSGTSRGPRVIVGLPQGSHHELGALAFATALRRRGVAVVYVGADLPTHSWQRAVAAFPTRAVVVGVPTADDRRSAAETARGLISGRRPVLVAAGGRHNRDLAPGVVALPQAIADAAVELDRVLDAA